MATSAPQSQSSESIASSQDLPAALSQETAVLPQETGHDELHPELLALARELATRVKRVLVTGAGGFLGEAICRPLLAAGIQVVGVARGHYPALEAMGATMVRADICDKQALKQALDGCELIFHVASKAGVWGSRASYFRPNVLGTENIIACARELGIGYLVYTSTPSVTFDGKDEAGIDESVPYARRYLNHYGASKSEAEELVLASAKEGLKTVAIRPHLIWGPGDPHLVPRVLERGRKGRLKLVGRDDKLVDTIYIDNAAFAHLSAARSLLAEPCRCNGKAYFVSNDQPLTMAAMLDSILACDNLPAVEKRVPATLAYAIGAMLEGIYRLLAIKQEPLMTRFVAKQLSCSHYYDISAAKRDLDYRVIVSMEQGMNKLRRSLGH
ncbi:2-alkyl-3-oxoalkanoate reductase [Shewanella algae]|uniref:2-alkyl-3-oxoalkanoate reductase n=1 Tax=Shewanella algae TaxID=38313 RepID=UPI0004B35830|nr:2-alkyl-3-oxoalkanoate reductase [Shewanella algae]MBO2670376.1 NAD-dependent epimerase/dehydratase family protein [Shewanella algae]QTE85166.1 NAD-dependent epimerase/dehydratase family protein [Shewanella algae]